VVWRFWFVILPSAEASNDPGDPWEAAGGIGISFAEPWLCVVVVDGLEGVEFVGREDEGAVQGGLAVAGLSELQGDDGGARGDGGKLEEAVGGFDLAVFDADTLLLEDPEELLDGPAGAVPVDDLPGSVGICGGMAGEQAPDQRWGAFGGRRLGELDQGHGYLLGEG
jgi:hypothetical protein